MEVGAWRSECVVATGRPTPHRGTAAQERPSNVQAWPTPGGGAVTRGAAGPFDGQAWLALGQPTSGMGATA